jgi:hypothetical protein
MYCIGRYKEGMKRIEEGALDEEGQLVGMEEIGPV